MERSEFDTHMDLESSDAILLKYLIQTINLPMWIIMEKYGLTENFLESMKDIPLHFPLM